MVSLSLVVPATDGPVTLERVLAAVERADPAPDEVIVVREPETLGPAAARNRGAELAAADVLVFLDADVEVHPDAFGRIRAAFEEDRELAALFGSYDDDPGGDGVVSAFRNLLHHHVHHEGAGPATTFWAGLGAVRREVFHSLGGFDATRYLHASVEDIELGMRLHATGARIVLDPKIQGKHLKTWTLMTMTETDLLRRGVPWLRLVFEGRSRSTALNLGPQHVVATGASVQLVIAVLRRDLRLALVLVALLLVLDRRFYLLLARRQGPRVAAAGVALHVAHRLTSAAAVPLALSRHLRDQLRPDRDA